MKTLLVLILSLTMFGCTSYSIEKGTDTNGTPFTKVKVKSTRDLEQPSVKYTRTGTDATCDFSAASVDNNTDAYLGMFTGMMGMMMDMMQKMMLVNVPTPPAE